MQKLDVDYSKDKENVYKQIIPQIKWLVEGESNVISNIANIVSVLKFSFNHLWTGVYLLDGEDLCLGPFQGPLACTRIKKGRGVCGTAWEKGESIIVPNVEDFPGHIACSELTRSEIVIPFYDSQGNFKGVLDFDSEELDSFDSIDQEYLSKIAIIIGGLYG